MGKEHRLSVEFEWKDLVMTPQLLRVSGHSFICLVLRLCSVLGTVLRIRMSSYMEYYSSPWPSEGTVGVLEANPIAVQGSRTTITLP